MAEIKDNQPITLGDFLKQKQKTLVLFKGKKFWEIQEQFYEICQTLEKNQMKINKKN